ncbi:rhodanese-like domain-containing protein [Defluviimonas sp. D31]|jgi:rhodanese-related sulfurtransferase|uniref:rhodanese-like domain-containing protein n=1 Tax=Defluviimonas sp. D31 TaxID=3083253 RepID=UPI00296E7D82|nr:rhodanese-like domain-containing protein [Defluviimonas sp. D31]MDW4549099.1 rhodanese-like domain-containing protein [Defluviimonas sp. D31]
MTKCFDTLVAEAKTAVPAISVREAHDLHSKGTAVFVDPRPAEAIASTTGLIPGAYNVGLDDLREGMLPPALQDRTTPIVSACQAGPMGALAAHALQMRGFTDVHYLSGGTQEWREAGHPTEAEVTSPLG